MKKFGFTVRDLKQALEDLDDDLEVLVVLDSYKNVSGLCEVKKDVYSFFGHPIPCVILDSSENVDFDEDEDE